MAKGRKVRADRLRTGDRVKLEGDYAQAGWCRVGGVSTGPPVRASPDTYESVGRAYVRLTLTTQRGLVVEWFFYPESLLLRG